MHLGEKLRTYRKACDYSQEEIAEILGVTRQTISNWENLRTFPKADQLYKLHKIYKVETAHSC